MAMEIILVNDRGKQEKTLMEVETHDRVCGGGGLLPTRCKVARAMAEWSLENKDDELLKKRPPSHRFYLQESRQGSGEVYSREGESPDEPL